MYYISSVCIRCFKSVEIYFSVSSYMSSWFINISMYISSLKITFTIHNFVINGVGEKRREKRMVSGGGSHSISSSTIVYCTSSSSR